MESSPSWPVPVLYVAILLTTLFFLLRRAFIGGRRRRRLPPGPKPWPIIGNLDLIGPLPHRSLHALSLHYGPLMHLRFGSAPVVVGSSAATARLFLKTHDLNFVSRPRTAVGKHLVYNYSDITWAPYGPYWRQARKMCATELFNARRLDSYEYIRTEEVRSLLRGLFVAAGRPVDLKDCLSTVSLNVISRVVLGKKYTDGEEDAKEFKRMIDELFLLGGVLNIGDFIPWLDFLDLQGFIKRMKRLSEKLDRFLERVLDEHGERRRSEGERFVAKDMVDVLMQFADEPGLEVQFTRNGVKAFIQDLIAGGTESSAVAVEWAIAELLKRPRIFDKASEELDRVIGRERWVEEKNVQNLPYIEAIVKEVMRLHPVGPLLVPRMSREDCAVDGYDVPAGSRVLVNVWAIGRDPAIWDEPEEFRPERFVGSAIDMKGNNFELLPFGAGRRMCPGYGLGLKVVQVSLANLLHGFKWRLPDGMGAEELSMEEIFGLSTPRKVPLEAVAEPRLAAHLYD